jgi:hypothetical protein
MQGNLEQKSRPDLNEDGLLTLRNDLGTKSYKRMGLWSFLQRTPSASTYYTSI